LNRATVNFQCLKSVNGSIIRAIYLYGNPTAQTEGNGCFIVTLVNFRNCAIPKDDSSLK